MSVWAAGAAVVGAVVAATTAGVQASNSAKASKAAKAAQDADAHQRAVEQQNSANDESSQMAMAMIGGMSNSQGAGRDQQYLQLMGYDQSGDPSGGGQPAQPPDPSTPRQRMSRDGGGGGGGGAGGGGFA